jgi:hypothetical protein
VFILHMKESVSNVSMLSTMNNSFESKNSLACGSTFNLLNRFLQETHLTPATSLFAECHCQIDHLSLVY